MNESINVNSSSTTDTDMCRGSGQGRRTMPFSLEITTPLWQQKNKKSSWKQIVDLILVINRMKGIFQKWNHWPSTFFQGPTLPLLDWRQNCLALRLM